MPNGKPGDHPLTDILIHGASGFGEPVDSLVKELAGLPGYEAISEDVARVLETHYPYGPNGERAIGKALEALRKIRSQLGS